MDETTKIVITAILSPLMLKVLEYFFFKSSEQTRSVNSKIDGLSARVDELKDKNFKQAIEIEVLKAQLQERDRQMQERDRTMTERDKTIAELRKEIDEMRNERGIA